MPGETSDGEEAIEMLPHASQKHRLWERKLFLGTLVATAASVVLFFTEFQFQLEKPEEHIHMSEFIYKHSYIHIYMKHIVEYID